MAKKLAIIASKGTLDGAYPPFLLASTAAALGFEAKIFFTFYGLQLLKKELSLQVSPLGNPAMPMPVPVPNLLQIIPGMEAFATWMMRRKLKQKGVASIQELREACLETDDRPDADLDPLEIGIGDGVVHDGSRRMEI